MVGLYQRPLAGRLPSGCTGLAGLRPSGRPRGGHPHRGRPLHAGVPDRKSGEQGHRSARAPQFQAFGRTTARQPEQPSRVTPVGPRMAHPMVTSRLIPVALVVVNVFVENVLKHTGSDPVMRIESDGPTATIAVSDGSSAPAVRLASPPKGIDVSGLAIVAALSRAWGSSPTSSGKTVWAIIGPENQL